MPSDDAPLRASPLGPSRRQVLAGVGLLAAGGVAELVPLGDIEGWTPAPDTWPLAGYDLANTASTAVSPPTDPAVAWTDETLYPEYWTSLVVGPDRVYAGGSGLVALSRADGRVQWDDAGVPSGRLALREGTLFSATADESALGAGGLRAVDTATGETAWRADLSSEASSLLVAAGGVFVGRDGGLSGFDAAAGRRRWRAETNFSPAFLAVYDGDLYAALTLGSVIRFRNRDLLDVPLRSRPSVRWESATPATDVYGPPAVTADRVFVGQRFGDGPGVVACRRDSGEVEWTVGSGDPGQPAISADAAIAVREGHRVVAGLVYGTDESKRNRVAGFDPADGTARWCSELGVQRVSTSAVAGDLTLVGTADVTPESTGSVRAYDLDSGEERWRVDLPSEVNAITPVEGTVFVACRNGDVHALRD